MFYTTFVAEIYLTQLLTKQLFFLVRVSRKNCGDPPRRMETQRCSTGRI